jgi:hypothetical protein
MRTTACLLLLAVVGCSGKKADPESEDAVAVSDITLWEAYNDNAIAADEKYNGKLLKLTGTVHEVTSDAIVFNIFSGDVGIGLGGEVHRIPTPAKVVCRIRPDSKAPFAKAKKDLNFIVLGRCVGQVRDGSSYEGKAIVLEDCRAAAP